MKEISKEYIASQLYIPDKFDFSGGLWPVKIGLNLTKPQYQAGPRQISHYSMHFVRMGQVELHFNEDKVLLSKGDLFCLFPHYTYTYNVVSAEETLQMIWFGFNGTQSRMILSMLGLSPEMPYLRKRMTVETELVLQQMIKCMQYRDDRGKFAMYSLIFKLFGELLPHQDNGSRVSSMTNWVDKSVNFMKTHYVEKLAVKDVADYVGIHRSYFSKVFTETIGVPPINICSSCGSKGRASC